MIPTRGSGEAIRAILVPLDGSSFGEHALPLAVSVARRSGARLHLAHIHVPVPPPAELEGTPYYDAAFYGAVVDQEREYMEGMRERLAGVEGIALETALLHGSLPDALGEYGGKVGASLLVLSTHGYEGIRRLLQHGLADRMLRRMEVPVLAVRPEREEPLDDLGAEVRFRHVLVPLDGSPVGEEILRHALAVGRLFGASFTLLRVIRIPQGATTGAFGQEAPGRDPFPAARAREEAERYLGLLADQLRGEGVEARVRVEMVADPAAAILEVSREVPGPAGERVDLIAMETRARRGIARLIQGSVAGEVLQESRIPLLLHHAAGTAEGDDAGKERYDPA